MPTNILTGWEIVERKRMARKVGHPERSKRIQNRLKWMKWSRTRGGEGCQWQDLQADIISSDAVHKLAFMRA
jgi:hypothetical protein